MQLILDGRYLPIKLLGQGGFGAAYLASDRRTPANHACVVKQFQPPPDLTAQQMEIALNLFDREAEVLERLGAQHPQIPRLLAFFPLRANNVLNGETDQFFYLVQEYIQGKTLEELVTEQGPFSEAETVEVMRSMLGILQFVHENGAIHRDVKPSNIMRHDNGQYFLLDFGTVKQVAQGSASGATMGSSTGVFSAGFAPPEQMAGRAVYASTDLYSLGVTALVLLTGKLNPVEIFDAYSNRWQWQPFVKVDPELETVLERLLEPTPNQRYKTAAEVIEALNQGQSLPQTIVSTAPINPAPVLASPSSPVNTAPPAPVVVPTSPQNVTGPGQPPITPQPGPSPVPPAASQPPLTAQPQQSGGLFPLNPGKIALGILVALGLLGGGLWLTSQFMGEKTGTSGKIETLDSSEPERLSTGDVLLIAEDGNADKKEAIAAIANGDYDSAIQSLEASLQAKRNDPEALVYLNNAQIGDDESYTIAISIPYSADDPGTKNAAKELLRGIAQAQKEVNEAGGINGVPLRVAVITETNEPESTAKAAQILVEQSDVLGVIGHFGSGASLAAAEVYEKEGLVMISPTSTSTGLSQAGKYIFRTVPSDNFTGKALARYMVEGLKKEKAAVFFNGDSGYSKSLRDVFTESLFSNGGEVVREFDLNDSNFTAADVYEQAQQQGAEVLALLPNSATLGQTFEVIKENRGRLPMLGGDSPYRSNTLEEGGSDATGMVLAVPWHIAADPTADFPKMSRQLWGGDVSWRTAMTYDASQALIQALKEAQDRQGVQAALVSPGFAAEGASGTVRFLRSGDRNQRTQLVKIISSKGNTKFPVVFAPLP